MNALMCAAYFGRAEVTQALLNPFLNVGVMPMWLMDVAAKRP